MFRIHIPDHSFDGDVHLAQMGARQEPDYGEYGSVNFSGGSLFIVIFWVLITWIFLRAKFGGEGDGSGPFVAALFLFPIPMIIFFLVRDYFF